jgi:large subunit ribosomal protein L15
LTGDITPEILSQKGLIPSEYTRIKILGMGEIEVPMNITADKFSKSAQKKIEASGGSIQLRKTITPRKKEDKPKSK